MAISIKKITRGIENILGGKEGPRNPYTPPSLDYLRQPFQPQTQLATAYDPYAQRYLEMINAPSSVDTVRGEVEGQRMSRLLEGIDEDTNKAFGKGVTSFYRRGLLDPSTGAGISSDIASVGLSNIENEGLKRAADTRTTFALGELDRLARAEEAKRAAAGQVAQTYASLLSGGTQLQNSRDLGYASGVSNLYNSGQDAQIRGRIPGLLERTSFNFGFGG